MLTNVSFFLNTLFMVLMVVGSAVSLPNNTALGCLHCDQTCPTPDSAWAGPALLHVHLPSDKTSVRNWAPLPLQVCHLTKPQSGTGHHYHSKSAIWQNFSQKLDTITAHKSAIWQNLSQKLGTITTPSLLSDKTSVRNWHYYYTNSKPAIWQNLSQKLDTIIRPTPSLPSNKTSVWSWTPLSLSPFDFETQHSYIVIFTQGPTASLETQHCYTCMSTKRPHHQLRTQHSYILMHTKKTIASFETHKLFINHTHGCTVLQTETFQQSCTAVPMT